MIRLIALVARIPQGVTYFNQECPYEGCAKFRTVNTNYADPSGNGCSKSGYIANPSSSAVEVALFERGLSETDPSKKTGVLVARLVQKENDDGTLGTHHFLYCVSTVKDAAGDTINPNWDVVLSQTPVVVLRDYVQDQIYPRLRRSMFKIKASAEHRCQISACGYGYPNAPTVSLTTGLITLSVVVTWHKPGDYQVPIPQLLVDHLSYDADTKHYVELTPPYPGHTRNHWGSREKGIECTSHRYVCQEGFNAEISANGRHVGFVRPVSTNDQRLGTTAGISFYSSGNYGYYSVSNNKDNHAQNFKYAEHIQYDNTVLFKDPTNTHVPLVIPDIRISRKCDQGVKEDYNAITKCEFIIWLRYVIRQPKKGGTFLLNCQVPVFGECYSSRIMEDPHNLDNHYTTSYGPFWQRGGYNGQEPIEYRYNVSAYASNKKRPTYSLPQYDAYQSGRTYSMNRGEDNLMYKFDTLSAGFHVRFEDKNGRGFYARGEMGDDGEVGIVTGGMQFTQKTSLNNRLKRVRIEDTAGVISVYNEDAPGGTARSATYVWVKMVGIINTGFEAFQRPAAIYNHVHDDYGIMKIADSFGDTDPNSDNYVDPHSVCRIVPSMHHNANDIAALCSTDQWVTNTLVVSRYPNPVQITRTTITRTTTSRTATTTTVGNFFGCGVISVQHGTIDLSQPAVIFSELSLQPFAAALLSKSIYNLTAMTSRAPSDAGKFNLLFDSRQDCVDVADAINDNFCLNNHVTRMKCQSAASFHRLYFGGDFSPKNCGTLGATAVEFDALYQEIMAKAVIPGPCSTTSHTTTTTTPTTERDCTNRTGFFINHDNNLCEECPAGKYIPNTDYVHHFHYDACYPQRGCARGQIEVIPGTSSHPPICGDNTDSSHCDNQTQFHVGNLTESDGIWQMKCSVMNTCTFNDTEAEEGVCHGNNTESCMLKHIVEFSNVQIDRRNLSDASRVEFLRRHGHKYSSAIHNLTNAGHADVHFVRLCEALTVCNAFDSEDQNDTVHNFYESVAPTPSTDRQCMPCPSLCAGENSSNIPGILTPSFVSVRDSCTFALTNNSRGCTVTSDTETGYFSFPEGRRCESGVENKANFGGSCRDSDAITVTTITRSTTTPTNEVSEPCNSGRYRSVDNMACKDCAEGTYTPRDGRDYPVCLERRRCQVTAGREAEELVPPERNRGLNFMCVRPGEINCTENEFILGREYRDNLPVTLCQRQQRCHPGQYVFSDATATSDRICKNCTLCHSYSSVYNSAKCYSLGNPPAGMHKLECRLDTPLAPTGTSSSVTHTTTTGTATTEVSIYGMEVVATFSVPEADNGGSIFSELSPHAKELLRRKFGESFQLWSLKHITPLPMVQKVRFASPDSSHLEATLYLSNAMTEFGEMKTLESANLRSQFYADDIGLIDGGLHASTLEVYNASERMVRIASANVAGPPPVSKFKRQNERSAWIGYTALGLFVVGIIVILVQLKRGHIRLMKEVASRATKRAVNFAKSGAPPSYSTFQRPVF